PKREMLQQMMDGIQSLVSGVVRLKLYKGSVTVLGRKSDNTLYREDFVTFEKDEVYNQADAGGFIRLNGLRIRLEALRRQKLAESGK
ncbi:MAG TPA: argininosuccinate synthase, partial [Polyangiaceae bacterium]|nr:argininosuccinate synthase [Polyangiaceae bacterium]